MSIFSKCFCSFRGLANKLKTVKLEECKIHNKLQFNINVRLHSVYDGDTIKVVYYNKQIEEPVIVSCRLKGIDTPEMKPPKNIDNRTDILIAANAAREMTMLYFENKPEIFKIGVEGLDKYGRWLITETELNEELIKGRLAKEYHGGTK